METAIGVFDSRDLAEQAVKDLLGKGVPQDAIVFLTSSEREATEFAEEVGAFAGGFLGGTVGMAAGTAAVALALVPGVGQVFALGVGATALFGFLGARSGAAAARSISHDKADPVPTVGEKSSEDVAILVDILKQGRSVIVVRTESQQVAAAACSVLDHVGPAAQASTSKKLRIKTRQVERIAVIDVSGRVTLGEGNVLLRETVATLLSKGNNLVLLNFSEVDYLDSSGIGELVRTHATIRKNGGQLKLSSLTPRINDLLVATSLHKVLEIHKDEPTAIKAFGSASSATA
jgi:anti-sigma B factor antagonist